MKKFKKLVPAFCMLLLSAVMLASGTYAWFSVNDRVSATGMQVEAKANTKFLVITNELNEGKFPTATTSTEIGFKKHEDSGIVEGVNHTNTLYPVFKATAENKDTITVTDGSKTLEVGNWYTANSTKAGSVAGDGNAIHHVSDVEFKAGDYFMVYTAYVGLAANSIKVENGTLTLTLVDKTSEKYGAGVTANSAIHCIAAVKQGTTAAVADDFKDLATAKAFTGVELAADETTFVTVTVYVYVDGFATSVFDGNVAALKAAFDIEIKLD